MRKILGTFALVGVLLAPTQIVAVASTSEETLEMNYLVLERMTSTEMRMSEMTKIMNYVNDIDILLQRINDGLEE